MTLVIFLIDNTPSMLQRTNIDGKYVSWLEVAKQAVKLFFARVVEKNIKEVRYMMLTYDAPPDHVKVGFNETYAQLVEALRTLECTGTQSVHRALQNLFELLNQERMMMGVDTYGHGRCPFYHMYTFIVLISKNYQRQQMSSTFLPLPRGAPGALLTKEPFRWDQRLFALILQYSSDDPNETKDSAISKYGTGLDLAAIDAMCQSTGGWSCLIRSPSHLLYHVQMVIECMKKKLIIDCESKSKGWWPFPEPGWVSSELMPRDAHPKLHVLAPRSEEPKWIPNFPVDKYELDMCSALCQHTLFTSACGMVWPVVVTSGSQTAKQLPFGYLKKTCSKILEHIFSHLDYRSRRNLTLVCHRWNAVLLSERYIGRNVTLAIDGTRIPSLHKCILHRVYPNLTLKLDTKVAGDALKALRLLSTLIPEPSSVELRLARSNESLWVAFCKEQFFPLNKVHTFHLLGCCDMTSSQTLPPLHMDELRTLKLEYSSLCEQFLVAPKLSRLYLCVFSKVHLNILPQFIGQLHALTVVFLSKECYNFFELKPTGLRELTIDRREKGMTKSDRNVSIAFFTRLVHLQRLELRVKFVDSVVLHTIVGKLRQLTDLSLQVAEGTIELKHISNHTRLERLRIVAYRVNLQNVHLPALRSFVLGSDELPGTHVEGFEGLMAFQRLRSLTLMNVKIYPEVLQLTPTYSVERMVIAHYRRIEETHLQMLVKRFPALRWLRVSHCHGLYKREIDKLKRMLPEVAIAFDEVKTFRL
uniref:F-box domain-containing protein n=1 Tax=Anopheles epiroticus TaxID=199890 RepID=A0A182P1K9_9DIPT